MDELFSSVIKNFSFTEIVCFFLLYRVEHKLAQMSEAVIKLVERLDRYVDNNEKRPNAIRDA